jgi:hypothetical protein
MTISVSFKPITEQFKRIKPGFHVLKTEKLSSKGHRFYRFKAVIHKRINGNDSVQIQMSEYFHSYFSQ